ncbi:MAG: hypothetical protein AAGG79_07435 [Pseudomonadota bacterium]
MSTHAVCLDDIRRAAPMLDGFVHRTSVLENLGVNALLGGGSC